MSRDASDESYVIDICDHILSRRAIRQMRFDFLCGDPSKNGRRTTLPVDAYYEEIRMVVEYWERQHEHPAPFFDRKMTCSGCTRGEQRRIYDKRKREVLGANGISLVVIKFEQLDHTWQGRLKRSAEQDMDAVSNALRMFVSDKPDMKPDFEVGDLVKVGIDEDGYFTPWNSFTQRGFRPCVVDAVELPGKVNRIAVKTGNERRLFPGEWFKKVQQRRVVASKDGTRRLDPRIHDAKLSGLRWVNGRILQAELDGGGARHRQD